MSVITFNEDLNGWSSFHNYSPEGIEGLFGSLYSFKNGQLYIHNADGVDNNTFYGESSPSVISFVINDEPSDRKILNNVILQGSDPWSVLLKAYIDNTDSTITSTIETLEFVQKEGIWYASTNRGEQVDNFNTSAAYGIGQIKEITGNNLRFDYIPEHLSEGDSLLKYNGSETILVGTVTNVEGNLIELDSVFGLDVSNFMLGYKDPREEGDRLRGYSIGVTLENTDYKKDVELFSVDYEVIKSFM